MIASGFDNIIYRSGNILQDDADALVNTVNCVGVMGKGLALQFKQAWPDNFKAYKQICDQGRMLVGKVHVWETGRQQPRYIVNFPTKRHWKSKSKLPDIEKGLTDLAETMMRLGVHSVAVPPLGCGLGGLDWKEVRDLMERIFALTPSIEWRIYPPAGAPEPTEMPVATEPPMLNRKLASLIIMYQRYNNLEGDLTLLEAQIGSYFLQESGENLGLCFTPAKMGPYANSLNHMLQKLEGHYIRGYGDRTIMATIAILPDGAEQAKNWLKEHAPDALDNVEKAIDTVWRFTGPYTMELLSTVHWLMHHENISDPEKLQQGVWRWNRRKAKLFTPSHIQKAYEFITTRPA